MKTPGAVEIAVFTNSEVFVGHRNARLTFHGRCLLVHRVRELAMLKPHCSWQNGKVERFKRTLQTQSAYRQAFTTNDQRSAALAPWLEHYNTQRRHSALGGPPTHHPTVTNLTAEYT